MEIKQNIAVLIHVYFSDVLIEKLIPKLLPLADKADFYFNFVRGQETEEAIELIKNTFKRYTIIFTEQNVGRDVNGQLNNLKHIYSHIKRYEYYLFLHTKKSVHLPKEYGEAWLSNLTSIVKDEQTIQNIINDFNTKPKLGMVCNERCKVNLMTINEHNVNVLSNGFGMKPGNNFWFSAGTMFWVRAKIFDTFYSRQHVISRLQSIFREENGATDGELHHAMERIMGKQVYELGYYINEPDAISYSNSI